MIKADFYVMKEGNNWSVRLGDKSFPCLKQSVAMKAAVKAAHIAGTKGLMSQVLVEGPDGQWQTQWVYGIDEPLSA